MNQAELEKLIEELRRAAATFLSDEIQFKLEKLIEAARGRALKIAA
jgi:hypothetical protein